MLARSEYRLLDSDADVDGLDETVVLDDGDLRCVLRRRPRPTVYGRQHPGRRVRPGNEAVRIGMDYRRRSTGRSPGRRRHGAAIWQLVALLTY
ncbi:hypothetical protein GS425_11345 [Rhodococcus hoagii]|nr:hypothetical protein [Prescottella equi]